MLNKNLRSLLQSLLRLDGTISSNLKVQLLVVGALLNTIVLTRILYIHDWSVNRVDWQQTKLGVLRCILLCRYVATALTNGDGELHLRTRCEVANYQLRIENLERGQEVRNVTRCKLGYSGNVDSRLLEILILDGANEANLLEIQDDIQHILHYARNSGKLVVNAVNLNGCNSITLQRREQYSAQSITDSHRIARLQRTKLKLSERCGRFYYDYLLGSLKR